MEFVSSKRRRSFVLDTYAYVAPPIVVKYCLCMLCAPFLPDERATDMRAVGRGYAHMPN